METLVERLWTDPQDLMGELIVLREDGTRLRALLQRNAYDFQSSLKSYAWTEEGWKLVSSRPISLCTVKKWSYVTRDDFWQGDALADMKNAITEASAVVPTNHRRKGPNA